MIESFDTCISFYLSSNRIHIFLDALRFLGSPPFVRFLLSKDHKSMVMQAYDRLEFTSLRVPNADVESTKRNQMEVASIMLCQIIKGWFCWTDGLSYRVPGRYIKKQNIILFDLTKAYAINMYPVNGQGFALSLPEAEYAIHDC